VSIDYGERERQFLATLEADSGKPLEAWMAAIRAQGLTHRNDIIDWLRRQGFMFSKASWLERIHNNGGKPIYDGAPAGRRPQTRPRQTSAPTIPATPEMPASPTLATALHQPAAERPRLTLVVQNPPPAAQVPETPRPAPPHAAPAPVASPTAPAAAAKPQPVIPATIEGSSDPAAIDTLLARAKAFRPLAVYVTTEIRKRVPDVAVTARDGYLAFANANGAFALLAVSSKELKLGLALKRPPADAALEAGKLAGPRGAPPVSHVATLTDARQVTPALMAAIAEAASGT
jgi:hypothetical protein